MRIEELEISFTGSRVDRADAIRGNPVELDRLRRDPASRLLEMTALDPPMAGEQLAWAPLSAEEDEAVFLGLLDGAPRFAALRSPPEGWEFSHPGLWNNLSLLPAHELALYAGARSLLGWHQRHRFCANCGSPTVIAKGGWQRNCVSETCRAEHFPRTDPVAIMLVERDGRMLLGRQPRFPPRSFSALAGFIEPGETIEGAVAREVHEEVGLVVRDVTYVASQPWPFPSSLMIGCHAVAEDDALTIDHSELEDARWFTREDVVAALAGKEDAAFLAPSRHAIARKLLEWWVAR